MGIRENFSQSPSSSRFISPLLRADDASIIDPASKGKKNTILKRKGKQKEQNKNENCARRKQPPPLPPSRAAQRAVRLNSRTTPRHASPHHHEAPATSSYKRRETKDKQTRVSGSEFLESKKWQRGRERAGRRRVSVGGWGRRACRAPGASRCPPPTRGRRAPAAEEGGVGRRRRIWSWRSMGSSAGDPSSSTLFRFVSFLLRFVSPTVASNYIRSMINLVNFNANIVLGLYLIFECIDSVSFVTVPFAIIKELGRMHCQTKFILLGLKVSIRLGGFRWVSTLWCSGCGRSQDNTLGIVELRN